MIKQISVFVENKPGRLAEITKVLKEKNVDIRALSIADTTDFGILRMIADNPDLALEALRSEGLTVTTTDVIAVGIEDRPGGLYGILSALNEKGISVEYAYAFITRKAEGAFVIIRVEDNAAAVEILRKAGVKLLTPEEVYTI